MNKVKYYVRRGVFLLERTISPEEKIRRAEEIYARRRQGYNIRNTATLNVSKENNYGLLKKMILQIAICLLIYFIFYLIQNSNYVFSEDVINKTKEILSYDIDIKGIYNAIVSNINNLTNDANQQNSNVTNELLENTINNTINENQVSTNNGIGGIELQNIIVENNVATTSQEQTNQEIPKTDEEYIKENFSFNKPIEGIVSSEFGKRDVENPIVSRNHTGIDIAANTGTVIKAAMEGEVTVSSTTGDYGYHIKISNKDITTLYAHCSKLYVKEGDVVTKGQEIAEVGSTGKSTGPHLHFEIMRGSTYINPRNILDF